MYRTSHPVFSTTLRSSRHSTAFDDRTRHQEIGASKFGPTPWIPVSLRKRSLACFVILYLASGLALVLLYVFAKQTNGLRLLIKNHYAWIYGPTAVLILIISLWRQLDYNCRVLIPWKQLASGNKDARTTIFLDYVSPFQLVTFYQAIVNKHATVILTTLGFFVLKIATIASTGLLVVQILPIATQDPNLLITTEFNYTRTSYMDVGSNLTSALFRAYGYLLMDMPYADGVTNSSAYQSVTLPSGMKASNTTYSAQVQAFSPIVDCQRVDVTLFLLDDQITGGELAWNFSIASPCNITQQMGWSCKPGAPDCPSSEFQFYTVPTDCGNPDQSWLFLAYGQFLHSQYSNDTGPDPESYTNYTNPGVMPPGWNLTPGNDSSWMCKIDYELHHLNVQYESSRNGWNMVQLGEPEQVMASVIPGLSPANLTTELYWGFRSNRFDKYGVIYLSDGPDRVTGDPLLGMMKQMVNGTESTFTEKPDSMGPAAEIVLRQVASQIVAQVGMQPANISTGGNIYTSEARLQVSMTIIGLMAGCLFLMAGISAALLWLQPIFGDIFERPDSIRNVASLFDQSEDLRSLMSDIGGDSEKSAMCKSRCMHYSTDLDENHNLRIQVTTTTTPTEAPSTSSPLKRSTSVWWTPLTLQKPLIALSILVPVLSVGILEFLQKISDRYHGFVALSLETSPLLESLYTRFLPALVMLLIATLTTSLDFNAAVLAPFGSLKREHDSSFEIISTSVLGKLPPLALLSAAKQRQWSSAFAAAAAFISSLLTITVSGLYTVELTTLSRPIGLKQQGVFRLEWNNSVVDDGGAAVVLSLIEGANLTQPAFTHDELVFPALSLAGHSQVMHANDSGLIEIQVPALRANLECHDYSLPTNWTLHKISKINSWSFGYQSSVPLPSDCLLGGPYANQSILEMSNGWTISPAGNDGMFYVANLMDIHVGPYTFYNPSTGEGSNYADNPPGCPSLALSWGWADTSRNISSGVAVMVCNQQIQQISTKLTLTYPNLTIPASHPPVVNESDVKILESGPNNTTAFSFRIQNALTMTFSLFNQSGTSHYELYGNRMLYDGFFTGVIFGKNQLGSNFQVFDANSKDKFMKGINSFYRRYMAQVMNTKMRFPSSPDSEGNTQLNATVFLNSSSLRIVQHNNSKIILQAILSTIVLLSMLSLHLGTFHKVVPWNPCTIAGIAVLFSGSTMYKRLGLNTASDIEKDRNRNSASVTDIEDTDEGTPLIGCNAEHDARHNNANDTAAPLWERFSTQSRKVRADENRVEKEKQNDGIDLRIARLRLGWWKDGVFYGDTGPTKKEIEADCGQGKKSWRYGIDCLSATPA